MTVSLPYDLLDFYFERTDTNPMGRLVRLGVSYLLADLYILPGLSTFGFRIYPHLSSLLISKFDLVVRTFDSFDSIIYITIPYLFF